MTRWFRHYAGMMRDDKLVSVAIRCKQPIERVTWVWGAILESASEIDDDGTFRLDPAEVAYFLRADEADILAVLAGLADAGRVAGDRVVKWGDRQFKSDRSAERQSRLRDKRRAEVGGSDDKQTSRDDRVTSPSRHGDAPETEAETDTSSLRSDERARRPTRLPQDWVLPGEWRGEAIAKGLPPQRADLEGQKMRDWSLSSKNGARRDWLATWRNWYREAIDRLPQNRAPPKPQTAQEIARDLLRSMGPEDANTTTQTQGNYPALVGLPGPERAGSG